MKIIDECDDDLSSFGFVAKKCQYGIEQNYLSIKTKQDEKSSGWGKGEYYIINCPNLYLMNHKMIDYVENILVETFQNLIKSLDKKPKKVLVVGLGNREIICDSFGVFSTQKIVVSGGLSSTLLKSKVYCLCPMVETQSGIQTYLVVESIAKSLKVDLVILIDSLMTKSVNRLGHSFQFSSSGIIPGGAVGKTKRIDKNSLGIDTISIGVPFMMDLSEISDNIKKHIVVAPKDISYEIKKSSDIIANVLNRVFYPNISKQEICELLPI